MLERREQIRTQASFLFANGIQIPALQQQRKKTLREIFCLFRSGALSPHERINRSPIGAAKFLKRRLCSWCWTLGFQNHAPMRRGKRRPSVLSGCRLTNPGQRSDFFVSRHSCYSSKSRCRKQACVEAGCDVLAFVLPPRNAVLAEAVSLICESGNAT